ncbi:hypothetical protein [Endozoicomonas ascidiicola]|uniref:hypothetical protein n=1 Tax=Endozoicomonas ascidiicola TaxID=1698521 RepID=UPI00082DEFB9|nr:hypothetical protein [Endozoicomonas ascidiicola]
MSISQGKENLILTGKEALYYTYQTHKENGKISAALRALSSRRKVEINIKTTNQMVYNNSKDWLAKKILSRIARPKISFPLTKETFNLMSRHDLLTSKSAQSISQLLGKFCPAMQQGKLTFTDILSSIQELQSNLVVFKKETNIMYESFATIESENINGKLKSKYKLTNSINNPDKDFSITDYRKEVISMLEGQIVQLTNKLCKEYNKSPIHSNSKDLPASLLRQIHSCNPDDTLNRMLHLIKTDSLQKIVTNSNKTPPDNNELSNWINSFERINLYSQLSETLYNSGKDDLNKLGREWKQKIDKVLNSIDEIFTKNIHTDTEIAKPMLDHIKSFLKNNKHEIMSQKIKEWDLTSHSR